MTMIPWHYLRPSSVAPTDAYRPVWTSAAAGFTLLELLVAIAIFAVLAAMAYAGLNSVLNNSRYATQQVERLAQIQVAVATISRDLIQIMDRPIRDEYGDVQLNLRGGGVRGATGIEFTRGGRRNPGGFPRSSLQRISYTLQEGQLLRLSWPVLDRAPNNAPISVPIIDKLKTDGFMLRFMDANGTWHEQWPPANTIFTPPPSTMPPTDGNPTLNQPMTSTSLPRAIEVTLDFEDFGRIIRIYPIY